MEPKDNKAKQTLLYNEKKKISMHKKIDLRTVVLIDSNSTLNLFCNPYLVEDKKVKIPLRIQINVR